MMPTPIPQRPMSAEPPSANAPAQPGHSTGEADAFAQVLQQAQGESPVEGRAREQAPMARGRDEAKAKVRPDGQKTAHEARLPRRPVGATHDAASQDVRDPSAADSKLPVGPEVKAADTALTEDVRYGRPAAEATHDDDAPLLPALPATTTPIEGAQDSADSEAGAAVADVGPLRTRVSARIGGRDPHAPARNEADAASQAGAAAARDAGDAATKPFAATPIGAHVDLEGANSHLENGAQRVATTTIERGAQELSGLAVPAAGAAREGAPASGASHAAPVASLSAAIDEPHFASAFGAQVALWVREGVQEARLHLHPAELGPVAVQIALDGKSAQVDFTAAVAATRDSIEQSLPALAAALRDAGFTLSGGGVFAGHGGQAGGGESNQTAEDDRRGQDRPGRAHEPADVTSRTPSATPRRWGRALLDLYA